MHGFRYTKCTFPILKFDSNGNEKEVLGTGFFILNNGGFLTAKHVFENNPLQSGESYKIAVQDNINFPVCEIEEEIIKSNDFDIAFGRAENIKDAEIVLFPDIDISTNVDVLTCEYSGAEDNIDEDGKLKIILKASVRKGNIICDYYSEFPEKIKTRVLELSFAALQGASGAPIIVDGERELLPAQILTVHNRNGTKEEYKYFLPSAKAIHWIHLKEFVDSVLK